MPILFDRDIPSLPSSADRLPPRAQLQIDIINADFPDFLKEIVDTADTIANATQPLSFFDTQSHCVIPKNHDDQSVTYLVTQGNLLAIATQDGERAYASITIKFKPGNKTSDYQPIMTIKGHYETYKGPMPNNFSFDPNKKIPENIDTVGQAIIQALMVPHVDNPQTDIDTASSSPGLQE